MNSSLRSSLASKQRRPRHGLSGHFSEALAAGGPIRFRQEPRFEVVPPARLLSTDTETPTVNLLEGELAAAESEYDGALTEYSDGDAPLLSGVELDLDALLGQQDHIPDQDEFWKVENEVRLLVTKERRRRTTRPLTTSKREWPHAKTSHSVGRTELPAATVDNLEADHSHGVASNMKPEDEAVARLQKMPYLNKPATRARRDKFPGQELSDGKKPRLGRFSDLFERPGKKYFAFSPRTHGPWVRQRLIEEARGKGVKGRRARFWKLTPERLEAEIIHWHECNADDLIKGLAWKKAGAKGRFRPKTKTWIITQDCMPAWARKKVWDTAEYFGATPEERQTIQIELQDWSAPPSQAWNAAQFQKWGSESHLPDKFGLQCICETAIWLPFDGEWSTTLQPNAVGIYPWLETAQEATNTECAEGFLSSPVLGPPLWPLKLSPRNVAAIWKDANIKTRPTANVSAPDVFHKHCPGATPLP